jgi:hypothetical protein
MVAAHPGLTHRGSYRASRNTSDQTKHGLAFPPKRDAAPPTFCSVEGISQGSSALDHVALLMLYPASMIPVADYQSQVLSDEVWTRMVESCVGIGLPRLTLH